MDLFARFIGIWMVFVIYIAVNVEGVAYGGACTADSECSTDTNANKCDIGGTDTCICGNGFFRESSTSTCTATLALDAACDVADSGQCTVANAECLSDSGTTKCLCKTTHYLKGSACPAKIVPDTACATGDECVSHATCDTTTTNTCVCDAGYTKSPTTSPTMCSGVVKFATLPYMYVVTILVSMMSLLR